MISPKWLPKPYRNIDIKNIEAQNHIAPKSLKFHIEPAVMCMYVVL